VGLPQGAASDPGTPAEMVSAVAEPCGLIA